MNDEGGFNPHRHKKILKNIFNNLTFILFQNVRLTLYLWGLMKLAGSIFWHTPRSHKGSYL